MIMSTVQCIGCIGRGVASGCGCLLRVLHLRMAVADGFSFWLKLHVVASGCIGFLVLLLAVAVGCGCWLWFQLYCITFADNEESVHVTTNSSRDLFVFHLTQ